MNLEDGKEKERASQFLAVIRVTKGNECNKDGHSKAPVGKDNGFVILLAEYKYSFILN